MTIQHNIITLVKRFEWDDLKNQNLKKGRSISFESVVDIITQNLIVDIIDNPNQKRYPKQQIFIILFNNYVYCIPFVEDEHKIFLKTIYASRKLNKKYNKK